MKENSNEISKNDIIANSKKKIAYLNTLALLANNMTNTSTILKGFLATSSIATVIQRFNEFEWINIIFIIAFTVLIMLIDMYYLQMSRWYRAIYGEVTKLREDSEFFAWEFNNKFNFNTNLYDYQKIKPRFWRSWTSKSICAFYSPLILIDITIGCMRIENTYFSYGIPVLLWISALCLFIYSYLKDQETKNLHKKDIWEVNDIKSDEVINNEIRNFKIESEEDDLQIELGWENINKRSIPIDCDVSVIICGEDGKVIYQNPRDYLKNLVCFNSPYYLKGAIEHCGDNPFGLENGTTEKIIVKLDALPEEVYNLFFVVNIYDGSKKNQDFSMLKKAYLQLTDLNTGKVLSGCNLDLDKGTGYEAAVLNRQEDGWYFSSVREAFEFNSDRLGQIINNRYK